MFQKILKGIRETVFSQSEFRIENEIRTQGLSLLDLQQSWGGECVWGLAGDGGLFLKCGYTFQNRSPASGSSSLWFAGLGMYFLAKCMAPFQSLVLLSYSFLQHYVYLHLNCFCSHHAVPYSGL